MKKRGPLFTFLDGCRGYLSSSPPCNAVIAGKDLNRLINAPRSELFHGFSADPIRSDQALPTGRLGFSEAEASIVMTLNDSRCCPPGGDAERHPAPELPGSSSDIRQKKQTPFSFRATRQIRIRLKRQSDIFLKRHDLYTWQSWSCTADFAPSVAGRAFAAVTQKIDGHIFLRYGRV